MWVRFAVDEVRKNSKVEAHNVHGEDVMVANGIAARAAVLSSSLSSGVRIGQEKMGTCLLNLPHTALRGIFRYSSSLHQRQDGFRLER